QTLLYLGLAVASATWYNGPCGGLWLHVEQYGEKTHRDMSRDDMMIRAVRRSEKKAVCGPAGFVFYM
ncbi:MAG: hypothetical protein Q4D55_12070, partial [Eubacteriales bacterium]|nr:hypothetical protein [Eubacteriales bacterium]